MNCGRARKLLALAVEEERSSSLLRAHLDQCTSCRAVARQLTEDSLRLRSMRDRVMPHGAGPRLRQSVVERLEGPEGKLGRLLSVERALRTGRRPRYALAGLAILLAATLGLPFLLDSLPGTEESGIRIAAVPPPPPARLLVPPERPLTPVVAGTSPAPAREGEPVAPVNPEPFDPYQPPEPRVLDLASLTSADEQPDTLLMKLTTDDPNIVIYWLASDKEPSRNMEGGI